MLATTMHSNHWKIHNDMDKIAIRLDGADGFKTDLKSSNF